MNKSGQKIYIHKICASLLNHLPSLFMHQAVEKNNVCQNLTTHRWKKLSMIFRNFSENWANFARFLLSFKIRILKMGESFGFSLAQSLLCTSNITSNQLLALKNGLLWNGHIRTFYHFWSPIFDTLGAMRELIINFWTKCHLTTNFYFDLPHTFRTTHMPISGKRFFRSPLMYMVCNFGYQYCSIFVVWVYFAKQNYCIVLLLKLWIRCPYHVHN